MLPGTPYCLCGFYGGGCWSIQVEMQGRVLPSFTRGTRSFQITPKQFSPEGQVRISVWVSFIDSAHFLVLFLWVVLLNLKVSRMSHMPPQRELAFHHVRGPFSKLWSSLLPKDQHSSCSFSIASSIFLWDFTSDFCTLYVIGPQDSVFGF